MVSTIGVVGQQRGPMHLEEALERRAREGESPVFESKSSRWSILPSRAEHEKFRLNLPGPPGKAKYSHMTDSETVP